MALKLKQRIKTMDKDSINYLPGSNRSRSFRCEECGCNVFRQLICDELKYKCNSCGIIYRAER